MEKHPTDRKLVTLEEFLAADLFIKDVRTARNPQKKYDATQSLTQTDFDVFQLRTAFHFPTCALSIKRHY